MRNASLTSTGPKSTPDVVEISKLLEVNHGKQVEDVSKRCWPEARTRWHPCRDQGPSSHHGHGGAQCSSSHQGVGRSE